MMASEQPASPSVPEEVPPEPTLPAPAPKPTHGVLEPSPFLSGFDLVLAIGTIILGFAIASFAVKNSDFWLHAAMGRDIAQGHFKIGTAPFTYAGAERFWVNHSLLWDWFTYQVYNLDIGGGGGRGIVIFKALLMAALTVVLLAIKKPGVDLCFGVVMVGLALLASAPVMLMRPALISGLFLALTLFLIFRSLAGLKTIYLLLGTGAMFCLWSWSDQWFFLGPTAIALFLAGEVLQRQLTKPVEGAQRPSLRPLVLALVVGTVACMLNMYTVRIWELPAELSHRGLGKLFENDPGIAALFRGSLDKTAFDLSVSRGNNPLNSAAFALLFVANVAVVIFNFHRASWGLLLVNFGMLVLGFMLYNALLFYAIVAAPVTALNLGDVAAWLRRKTLPIGILQLLNVSRVGLRVFLLLAGLAALIACYPGWLQPIDEQRRLSFEVEGAHAFQKTAQTLQQLRAEAKLSPKAHSLIFDVDLANACAWFAPEEQTYFDSRLGLHWPEAATFVKLRKQILDRPAEPGASEPEWPILLENEDITHIVVRSYNRSDSGAGLRSLLGPQWLLFAISDRYSVCGWRKQERKQEVISREQFGAMRFDPYTLAFGPDVELIKDPPETLSVPKREFLDKFESEAPPFPSEADESVALQTYALFTEDINIRAERDHLLDFELLLALGTMSTAKIAPPPLNADPIRSSATALLALRSARRAILQSPDHPEGYLRLAFAYNDRNALIGASTLDRNFLITAMLERYFARATPEQLRENPIAGFQAAILLADMHFHPLCRRLAPEQLQYLKTIISPMANTEAKRKASRSLASSLQLRNEAQLQQWLQQFQGIVEIRPQLGIAALKKAYALMDMKELKQFENHQKLIKNEIDAWEAEIAQQRNTWLNDEGGTQSMIHRAFSARHQYSLFQEALDLLKKLEFRDERIRFEDRLQAAVALVDLYLLTGQPEEAEKLLETESVLGNASPYVLLMRVRTAMVLGRFSRVIEIKQGELEAKQRQIEHSKRLAFSLKLARQLGRTGGPFSLMTLLEESYIPFIGNQYNGFLAQGLPGNPYQLLPLFDEFIIRFALPSEMQREQTINFDLGLIYLEQGNNAKALHHFDKAIKDLGQQDRDALLQRLHQRSRHVFHADAFARIRLIPQFKQEAFFNRTMIRERQKK